jgi:hypothetical protein
MPVLPNPRHEAYAQAFFAGIANGDSQEKAYRTAGYRVTNSASARACASRLMLTIANRVRELQAEQNKRLERKLDLSKERVGRRLDLASRLAEKQENPAAIAQSELGIAKVFHRIPTDNNDKSDLTIANSIGRKLLQSIGLHDATDEQIEAAIAANDRFIEQLEAIRDNALGGLNTNGNGAAGYVRD